MKTDIPNVKKTARKLDPDETACVTGGSGTANAAVVKCPGCGSTNVKAFTMLREGNQYYICKECEKVFSKS